MVGVVTHGGSLGVACILYSRSTKNSCRYLPKGLFRKGGFRKELGVHSGEGDASLQCIIKRKVAQNQHKTRDRTMDRSTDRQHNQTKYCLLQRHKNNSATINY